MRHHAWRPLLTIGIAGAMFLGSTATAAADSPNQQNSERVGFTATPPTMTAEQQATYQRKLAFASQAERQYQVNEANRAKGMAASTSASGYVNTYPRQQQNGYFCGPTAVQVMSDYAWNRGANGVKYTQQYISDHWTHSVGGSGTSAVNELAGANGVLVGSPQSSFPYLIANPGSGANWMALVTGDVQLHMPQISNLAPWVYVGGQWYYLDDWASHQSTGGHYIVVNGYTAAWDGTRGPLAYFNDGSNTYGGGTGTFTTAEYDVYMAIHYWKNMVIW